MKIYPKNLYDALDHDISLLKKAVSTLDEFIKEKGERRSKGFV